MTTRVLAVLAAITIALGLPAGTRLPGGEPERPFAPAPTSVSAPAASAASPIPSAPEQPIVPARVSIPHLDIDADVIPVGITADAAMEVPTDIRDVGWYTPTAPGSFETGSTVLVGHRDGVGDPNGVFRYLEGLEPGRRVRITDTLGATYDFRVQSTISVPDNEFSLKAPALFTSEGPARLVLLTCGGEYVRSMGGYQSTVIVIATPD